MLGLTIIFFQQMLFMIFLFPFSEMNKNIAKLAEKEKQCKNIKKRRNIEKQKLKFLNKELNVW